MLVSDFINIVRLVINEPDKDFISDGLIMSVLNDGIINFCSNTNIYHGLLNMTYEGSPLALPADLLRIIDVKMGGKQLYPIDYTLLKTLMSNEPSEYYYILDYMLDVYPPISSTPQAMEIRYVRVKETYTSIDDTITLSSQFINVIKNYVIWKLKFKEEDLNVADHFKKEYFEELQLTNVSYKNFSKSTTIELKNEIVDRSYTAAQ